MINYWGVASIAVFYLLILVIGIWASRNAKKKSSAKGKSEEENMIVAGRDLGPCLSLFSTIATAVCGAYLTGIAEIICTPTAMGGLLWCLIPLGTFGGILCGLLVAKPAREGEFLTMIEPFERHYGRAIGALFATFSIFAETMWTAGVLNAFGATISVVMDTDNTVAVIVSSCIVVFYTLLGGLYAVAYTDVVQIICVFFGLWACVPFAMTHPSVKNIASTAAMNSTISNSTRGWVGELQVSDIGLWIDQALTVIIGGIPWSSCIQRLLACRSASQAQAVSIIAGCAFLIFSVPSILIGAIAASAVWEETEYNRTFTGENAATALPMVLQYLTPVVVAFVGLGALSAAVMSSADSAILASGSLFSQNIYKSVIRPSPSNREIMWVMRVTMVIVGVLATVLALTMKGVYYLYLVSTEMAYVLLCPQLILVLNFKQYLNEFGCLSAIVSGVSLFILFGDPNFGLPALIKLPFYDEERQLQLLPTKTICMLVTLFTLPTASFLWRCVMDRKSGGKSKQHSDQIVKSSKEAEGVEKDELLLREQKTVS